MKAVYCPRYGSPDVLEIREMPTPTLKPQEVLVRIHAANLSSGDARIRAARFPRGIGWAARLAMGLRGPRNPVLGFSAAGVIEEIGANHTRFKPGQRVVGIAGQTFGTHAEYRAFGPKSPLLPIPDEMDFETATALTFGGTTALQFLEAKGKLRPGERVLVLGASGQVGIAAVQIAKHLGAYVVGVCSERNTEQVLAVGADATIDYARTDFTQGTDSYDIIMDCVGATRFSRAKAVLRPNGRFLIVDGGDLRGMMAPLRGADSQGRRAIGGVAEDREEDIARLIALWQAGEFDPVISKRFPLAEARAAHRLVDSGRKLGSVVLTM